jgi:hypothetical protein
MLIGLGLIFYGAAFADL